ncbi:MAG: 3-deoxy-D-manno-octulosonic acid transferase [Alphaproteobacteria bacterium]|nr:3-deoxy-D-manno-octulosonic acid transferase [Alphaproteobacteria bacterium]
MTNTRKENILPLPLKIYRQLTERADKPLMRLLDWRLKKGKELKERLNERQGKPQKPRPEGKLIWLHAASVGEAQSALILIDKIIAQNTASNILVTSGTVTSAELMAKRLPERAFHQFIPLDHPEWVQSFLDHWKPDMAFLIESELWPNLLLEIKERKIPATLVNARLSNASYRGWSVLKGSIKKMLSTFELILAQSVNDALRFKKLSDVATKPVGNIKYSAAPLPYIDADFQTLTSAINGRPTWVYASTHLGEETLACRIHERLRQHIPNLLTIIVPRHPERREEIQKICDSFIGSNISMRGEEKQSPTNETDIYVADTLGELGLFYKLSDVAMIGRSFSADGGGGHNPLEASQYGLPVLTGPNFQYQEALFEDMIAFKIAKQVQTKEELHDALLRLFNESELREKISENALKYTKEKQDVIDIVMQEITPMLQGNV